MNVSKLAVGILHLQAPLLRGVLAHDCLHPVVQKDAAVLDRGPDLRDEVQRGVQCERKTFEKGEVIDVVVDHSAS